MDNSEAQRKLATKAFKKFVAFHVLKWGAICLTAYLLRKWAESLPE